ncbi:MAG: GT4 family glycosyltransferase PelF [Thiobacillus sp.]
MSTPLPTARDADIALLLEGTYPYVAGGVSSWVHQMILGFPEYRFACIFIGSRRSDYGEPLYPLPDNVVHVETHYLHDTAPDRAATPRPLAGDPAAIAQVAAFHAQLRAASEGEAGSEGLSAALMQQLTTPGIDETQFLHGKASWDYITEQYRAHCTDPSFVDYFWTVRALHQPIWQLHRIAQSMLPAKLYHSISTGYAGLLGSLLKARTGRPFLLSEHGIYTKERRIDLLASDWLADNRDLFQKDPTQISYFRELWIRFFGSLGRIGYDAADHTVALFETNRQRQLEDGADASRSSCIPNGIDLPRFSRLTAQRPATPTPVLCLIGRVVPIKDIKTFIRAMRIVVSRIPDAQGWIAGPAEEDPEYATECRALVASLGLTASVQFLGMKRVDTLFPEIGVTVLSSISEALPLVLLESMAAGVPVVATDVGACRDIVEGRLAEDRALGSCGAVVRIADPEALARAALDLLSHPERWHAAQHAGQARVAQYYRDSQML